MLIRRFFLALIIVLSSSRLSFAADIGEEADLWLLKAKRAGLTTFTVVSNEVYATRLFMATDGKVKVGFATDPATGLNSISVNGKCQVLFYRRRHSGYSNVSYFY